MSKSTKKQHPAEIAAEEQMVAAVRSADHFLASLFRGAGIYEKTKASTVAGALRAASNLENMSRRTQRCMIYAVGADGRATLLTNAFIDRMRALATA